MASENTEAIVEGAEPAVMGPLLAEAMFDDRWSRCTVGLISGGKSNLTYRVHGSAGEVILRRPPLSHILPTAHDMAREYRV
jgi:aminoglycoside phosphotransferase (APT) family kinase protein